MKLESTEVRRAAMAVFNTHVMTAHYGMNKARAELYRIGRNREDGMIHTLQKKLNDIQTALIRKEGSLPIARENHEHLCTLHRS